MRQFIALIGCWTLWALGDAVSRLMNYWPTEHLHPYRLYSRLMVSSSDVQDWGGLVHPWGPWYPEGTPPPPDRA